MGCPMAVHAHSGTRGLPSGSRLNYEWLAKGNHAVFRPCATGQRHWQCGEFKWVQQIRSCAVGGLWNSEVERRRPPLSAGSGVAVAAKRYWRPCWTASASPGPAIGPPTGSRWAKRRAGSDGPLSPSGWLRPQAPARLSPLPPRPATVQGGPATLFLSSRGQGRLGLTGRRRR